MSTNRIQDCWALFIEGQAEPFCTATPIEAAVTQAKAERKSTGKKITIRPMGDSFKASP
jgi:hypothetical protein